MSKFKKFWLFATVLIITIMSSIIVIVNKYVPESKAEENNSKTIKITFSPGVKNGLFENTVRVINANINSGYITMPDSFKDTVNINEGSYFSKVDDETYYFNEGDYSYTFTGWKIKGATTYTPMETVFQPGDVVNYDTLDINKNGTLELEAVWGKVIYAQNEYTGRYYTDYWIYDKEYTEQNYTATGAWNYKYEDNILTLNKGKDVNNPICSLDYAYFLLYNDSENEDINNAYLNVLMLKSDLDYIKGNSNSNGQDNFFTSYETYNNNKLVTAGFLDNKDNYTKTDAAYNDSKYYIWGDYTAQVSIWGYITEKFYSNVNDRNLRSPCFTFKSINNTSYAINWNAYGYSDSMYANLRFDNAMFKLVTSNDKNKRPCKSNPTIISSETYFFGRNYNYFEITSRTSNSKYSNYTVLRTGAIQTVVVNGGKFSSWQTSWGSSIKNDTYEIHWYFGKNAYITGSINLGTTEGRTNNISVDIPIVLTVTGGTIGWSIYGGSNGLANNDYKNRIINIIGDKENDTKTNPRIIGSVFGAGYQGKLTGNTYINIKSSNKISGSVYGGGYNFNATLYGDTYINIENSDIEGDIFAGGYNGNIEEDTNENGGNTNLKIHSSNIKGNIFGVGMGGTQSTVIDYNNFASNTLYNWKTTKFSPDDKFFTIGREEYYKDYNKDWSWEKPATGFPFLIKDESAPYYGYICTSTIKYVSWISNNSESLTFGRKRTFEYLSLAYVRNNVNIEITGSIIGTSTNQKGNIYGGGSIAVVHGNVDITVKQSTVYGNIYGGGDGTTEPEKVSLYKPLLEDGYVPPTYTIDEKTGNVTYSSEKLQNSQLLGQFSWSNDKSLLDKGGIDYDNKLIYSPNTEGLGSVEGNINLNMESVNIKGIVYGGGNAGDVLGEIIINIDGANISKNLYTGGCTGKVDGNTNLNIIDANIKEVFGGGYSGKVSKNSTILIEKGTYENIFGGGDQSYVQGNTDVTIGQENSTDAINVTGLVYGGGRGYDANNDGDASDFTTVYGNSKVLIQGVNTSVENYGSTKLGAVAGNVDVNFKNYWSGNSTAKYQTMNGRDRATTVSFENSYVLLENKDENGNLVGIQSIENLVIPNGSGLKISADGEITGNFEGGGELYLDSLVCLTVQGNITGQTTLVLNPKLMEDGTQGIKGGINVPYLKVGGTAPEKIALVSGETNKYVIMQADKETVKEEIGEDYIYYYIAKDVTVENNITIETNSIGSRKYKERVTNTNDALILNTGIFTTDFNVSYYLTDDAYKRKDYSNISRKLKMISNTDDSKSVTIPIGTEITMVNDKNYYFYVVEADNISEISLSDFKKADEISTKYDELKDITNSELVDKSLNEVNGTTTYTFKESYKFIINFANTEGIDEDRYYPSFGIYYGQTSFGNEKKDVANNIVDIQKRSYDLLLTKDREYYESNSCVKLTGNLKIGSLKENTYMLTKNLDLKIELKDSNNDVVAIPKGTQVKVNGNVYQVVDGQITFEILEDLGTENIEQDLNIELDMTNILPQDRIQKGEYKVSIEYLNSKKYKEITEIPISIINKQIEYGLSANINQIEGISSDRIQLITKEQEENRSIKIKYSNSSELKNMKIKVKAVERIGEFEYKDTTNSNDKINIDKTEINVENEENLEQNINIIFKAGVNAGTYRILVELYDEYGQIKTSDYVNFIVN